MSILDVQQQSSRGQEQSRAEKSTRPEQLRAEEPPRFRPPTAVHNTRFGFISTFPPTRCGLASFTDSLAVGLASLGLPASHVVRTCDDADVLTKPTSVPHAHIVGHVISHHTADPFQVNNDLQDCDVVIVQHEFGIFGGPDGSDIIDILENLDKPVIVVLHTVLQHPSDHQKFVVERVAELSELIVVMTSTAEGFLLSNYRVNPRKVHLIPHGVPLQPASSERDAVHPGTMLTWGLMGPGKGIEWGIMALALLQDSHPDLTYTIIGQTHPKVFERDGHKYREMLVRLADELGVGDRVIFDDRYIGLDDLGSRIRQSEIVLLPYDARNQVTSGVLVEALAANKKVISTAFPHAVELLANGAGEIVKHESPRDIASAIERLLVHTQAARPVEESAGGPVEPNSWPQVARQFLSLADTRISQGLSER